MVPCADLPAMKNFSTLPTTPTRLCHAGIAAAATACNHGSDAAAAAADVLPVSDNHPLWNSVREELVEASGPACSVLALGHCC